MIYFEYNGYQYNIKIQYFYPHHPITGNQLEHPNGCFVFIFAENDEDGKDILISYGESRCHESDQFIKKVGRRMALERALDHSDFGKDFRTAAWRAYHSRSSYPIQIQRLQSSLEDYYVNSVPHDEWGITYGAPSNQS